MPVDIVRQTTGVTTAIPSRRELDTTTLMNPPRLRRVTVTLDSDNCFYVSLEDNGAVGGIFIATQMDWPVGMHMVAEIDLPEISQRFRIRGIVQFIRPASTELSGYPPGVGIRFAGLNAETRRLVDLYSETRVPLFFDD